VTALGAVAQFGEHPVIYAVLGVDKALQVKQICAIRRQRFADSHIAYKSCKLVFGIQ
jgi:hypothetical protein